MRTTETWRYRPDARLTPLLLLLAVTLTACAGWFPTEEGYRQVLNTWIGDSGERLVAKWGVPSGEHTSPDGSKVYQFSESRTYTVSGGTKSERILIDGHYVDVDIPQPDETRETWCQTTFYLSAADLIQSYAYEGPDCTAYEKPSQPATSSKPTTQPQEKAVICTLAETDQRGPLDGIQLCPPYPLW